MNLTRILPRPEISMGAIPQYTDTGDGITPAAFQSRCCSGWFGTFAGKYGDFGEAADPCAVFFEANRAQFGTESPCSSAGIKNLNYAAAVSSMAPPEVPPKTLDEAHPTGTELWSFPYSPSTPACTGEKVVTEQDAALFQTCMAQRQAATQAAAVMAAMTQNAAGQCAAIKVDCANRTFAAFLSPSADCTDCTFDWLKPGSLFLIAGGLLVGGLILVKLLK